MASSVIGLTAMASTPISDAASPFPDPSPGTVPLTAPRPVAELAICLPGFSAEALPAALDAISAAFPEEAVLVAAAIVPPNAAIWPTLELVPYTSARSDLNWVLTGADYAAAAHLADAHKNRAVILLGDPEAPIDPPMLRRLSDLKPTVYRLADVRSGRLPRGLVATGTPDRIGFSVTLAPRAPQG